MEMNLFSTFRLSQPLCTKTMAVERLIRKTVANSKLRKGQECCVKLYPASIINLGKINDFWVIYENLVHLHLLSEGKANFLRNSYHLNLNGIFILIN